jgi:3-oxoacyl-[acyl-carrier-protein] synthase-3
MIGNATAHRVWRDPGALSVLGMQTALPGEPLTTDELLERLAMRFDVDVRRAGRTIARRLGVETRHVCRDFQERRERPRPGHRNCELAAEALRGALREAGLAASDLRYLIGHTASPASLVPPNVALVAELVGYDGPFLELRQACTGFANALVIARGLTAGGGGPVAIVGSETGSVFFDPLRAAQDHGQLVNLLQMGDGAAAIVVDRVVDRVGERPGATLSNFYFGQVGRDRVPGLRLTAGGSDAPQADGQIEFEHDFAAVRRHGPELFEQGLATARSMGVDVATVDYVVPHQANGRMAEALAAHAPIRAERVFVNADRVGNTGSAAIWLALAELRSLARPGSTALVLGAEATKHMFGGFLYAQH